MELKYKRILLKMSGEAFKANNDIYDKSKLANFASQVIALAKEGLQIGIVIGHGNVSNHYECFSIWSNNS
jgi:uridylate kinase